jgi:hypothetical protein
MLGCVHFLDPDRFEYDNEYEYGYGWCALFVVQSGM